MYGTTCEELYDKEQEARRQVAEIIFHREHPTVAEYCEKWLLMQSAKVSPATLKGYASNMKNYIIKPLGDMYMEEVTADDIRLALIPLSNKSESLHNTVNMLLKCIFYSAERSQLLEYNPCEGISAKGGETDPKERFADRPAGGSAAGNRQRTSAVSVYHDTAYMPVCAEKKLSPCNGIVCSSMHPLHISLCGAHGDQSITDRLSLQRLRRKQQEGIFPFPNAL